MGEAIVDGVTNNDLLQGLMIAYDTTRTTPGEINWDLFRWLHALLYFIIFIYIYF